MRLAGFSQSTLPHPAHIFCYDLEDVVASAYRTRFTVNKNPTKDIEEKKGEQDINGARGANKDDKCDQRESKNKGYATGSTNFAEAPYWKITAASMPHI